MGVLFYSNTMSLFSTLFIDEKAIIKGKIYNILLELNGLNQINRNLTEQIINSIENAVSESVKKKSKEWLSLVEHFDLPDQLYVAAV